MAKKPMRIKPQCDTCDYRDQADDHRGYYYCLKYRCYAFYKTGCKFYKEMIKK